jgi:hypothetical protein
MRYRGKTEQLCTSTEVSVAVLTSVAVAVEVCIGIYGCMHADMQENLFFNQLHF